MAPDGWRGTGAKQFSCASSTSPHTSARSTKDDPNVTPRFHPEGPKVATAQALLALYLFSLLLVVGIVAGKGCPERKGAATCVASPFSSPAAPLSRAAPPGPRRGPRTY